MNYANGYIRQAALLHLHLYIPLKGLVVLGELRDSGKGSLELCSMGLFLSKSGTGQVMKADGESLLYLILLYHLSLLQEKDFN